MLIVYPPDLQGPESRGARRIVRRDLKSPLREKRVINGPLCAGVINGQVAKMKQRTGVNKDIDGDCLPVAQPLGGAGGRIRAPSIRLDGDAGDCRPDVGVVKAAGL